MLTPRYHSRTIVAGGNAAITTYGKYITIVSISASTIELGIDDDNPQQLIAGLQIPTPESYRRILLRNTGGAASTVTLYTSDQQLNLVPDSVMAAILTALQRLGPAAAKTGGQSGAIAATGNPGTLILAANANRKSGFVQANIDNVGRVWLGTTNAVTQADSLTELLPGATSPPLNDVLAVYAVSENGTETVRYYETE